jgi:dihydrofolate synthase/folylpolyglutamate synthase
VALGVDFNFSGDKQQWAWAGRDRRYAGLAYPALRGANQLVNAIGRAGRADRAARRLPVTAQAVRNGLAMVELPGRFQIVPGQPTLVLDVAHNPHSVAALAANLDAMGFFPTTHAVFGAMADKDLAPMLQQGGTPWSTAGISPICPRRVRRTGAGLLEAQWRGPGTRKDTQAQAFADPVQALRAAVAAADPADRIVVFGSFYTVGGVLKDGVPRLDAKHLNHAVRGNGCCAERRRPGCRGVRAGARSVEPCGGCFGAFDAGVGACQPGCPGRDRGAGFREKGGETQRQIA